MTKLTLSAAVAAARALGHPARLRILAMLAPGELCVCQVRAVLALAPSTISAHLRELKRAGLVEESKAGRFVVYRLARSPVLAPLIEAALAGVRGDRRIAADAELVERLRRVPVEELCAVDLDLGRLRRDGRLGPGRRGPGGGRGPVERRERAT